MECGRWRAGWGDLVDRFLARSLLIRGRDHRGVTVTVVAFALGGTWVLVWLTGGTQGPYLHAAYLPVLLAATGLGVRAALATALAATLLLGPAMPLDVTTGTMQATSGWLFRGVFFLAIGGLAGVVVEALRARFDRTAMLRRHLAKTYGRSLRVFASLVEKRDEQTFGHCERVARNAVAIGRRLDLSEADLGRLYWAGLLHDLGKIGVPEAILRKPGPLTAAEMREVQLHCELGREILLDVSEHFEPIAEALLTHHEHYAGTGYPRGLTAEEIPLFGRILAVADVYEAVTSHRPYRAPMTHEEARRILVVGRGSHFDPVACDAFLAALDAGEIHHENEPGLRDEAFVETLSGSELIGENLLGPDTTAPRATA